MPSASRVIFVSIPFLLTLGTLVGVLLTFTGNVSSNTIAQYFHFLEVNTSGIPDLDAFYTVGLWNYW